jgi:DNA-binding XRE family transcriptional regulator
LQQQEQSGFTSDERKRFEAARKKLEPRIRQQVQAIQASQLISHEDLAICINSKAMRGGLAKGLGMSETGGKKIHALALLRNYLGESQEKFARLVELSTGTLAKIERGAYEANPWRVATKIEGVLTFLGARHFHGDMARLLVAGTLDEHHVRTLATELREARRIDGVEIGGSSNGNRKSGCATVARDGVDALPQDRFGAVAKVDRQAG